MIVATAPIIFKVELPGLTAQPTMEAELVVVALTTKEEVVFFPNMMLELDVDKSFGSVPLFIDNTSALHITANRTHIPRAKHIALRYYFFVQELVEGRSASTTSRARVGCRTWAPSTIASTVTATSSCSSTALTLETPTS